MMNRNQLNRVLALALLLGGLFSGLARPDEGFMPPDLWKRNSGITINSYPGNVGVVGGNVGIGTTSPGSLLDITGGSVTIRDSGSGGLQVGATDFVVTSAGSVGIGTNTPTSPLTVGLPNGKTGSFFQVSTGSTKIIEVNGASVVLTVPLFQSYPATSVSEIWLSSAAATKYGSGSSAIARFLTVVRSSGSCLSYADSAVLGASITVNCTGMYQVTRGFQTSVGVVNFGISVNAGSGFLSTAIQSIAAPIRALISQSQGANQVNSVSDRLYLQAGDILRPHDDPQATGTQLFGDYLHIVKEGP